MKRIFASAVAIVTRIARTEAMRYLFEVLIVFLGVYLAFLITDHQESNREREIRVQHYESLAGELAVLASILDAEEQKILVHMKIVEDIDQGKRPNIPPSDLLFVYPGSVRDSAFNSKHFESLDPDIVHKIIRGSFGLSLLEQSVESFNAQSFALLPLQATQEECCYDEEGKLLAHWQWYPRLVRDIHTLNRTAREGIIGQAIPDLRESIRKIQGLPPSNLLNSQETTDKPS